MSYQVEVAGIRIHIETLDDLVELIRRLRGEAPPSRPTTSITAADNRPPKPDPEVVAPKMELVTHGADESKVTRAILGPGESKGPRARRRRNGSPPSGDTSGKGTAVLPLVVGRLSKERRGAKILAALRATTRPLSTRKNVADALLRYKYGMVALRLVRRTGRGLYVAHDKTFNLKLED